MEANMKKQAVARSEKEKVFFVFFSKDDGLCLRRFLTLEGAKEGCAELADRYVTCIVAVSVEETYWWNGRIKQEVPVSRRRAELLAAEALDAAGVPLDTRSENREGIPTLHRTHGVEDVQISHYTWNVELTVPKLELTESEAQRYEARADVIAASEPIEVLFAIAAKLGMVDSLGGSEYKSWARRWIEP